MNPSFRLAAGMFCGAMIEPGTFHGMQIEPGTFHVAEPESANTGGSCEASASPDRSACLVRPLDEERAAARELTLPPDSKTAPPRRRRFEPLGCHFGIFVDEEG